MGEFSKSLHRWTQMVDDQTIQLSSSFSALSVISDRVPELVDALCPGDGDLRARIQQNVCDARNLWNGRSTGTASSFLEPGSDWEIGRWRQDNELEQPVNSPTCCAQLK